MTAGPSMRRRVWAIVPAAGRGTRFAGAPTEGSAEVSAPKQYASLAGATVLEFALRALLDEPRVHAVVVPLADGDAHWRTLSIKPGHAKVQTTVGGETRQESVLRGLEHLAPHARPDDWVLVHDAARPCLGSEELRRLLDAIDSLDASDASDASDAGDADGAPQSASRRAAGPAGAVLAAPIVDTVKRDTAGRVATVDRQGLWRALTPQVFDFATLTQALKAASLAGVMVTDEAQAIERMGFTAMLVPGSPFNIKVTRVEDLAVAEEILKMSTTNRMRVGQGFDVHAFGEGDHVVLGGVRIGHSRGVVAHSDGDVVIHALCDAVLGALGDGDIGRHFPDTDPRYRGADSRVFLRTVAARVHAAGLRLTNADVTVIAEAPRIAAHRDAMAANLAADLGVDAQSINIKATTTERLGFIGRGEGLAALASVLLVP